MRIRFPALSSVAGRILGFGMALVTALGLVFILVCCYPLVVEIEDYLIHSRSIWHIQHEASSGLQPGMSRRAVYDWLGKRGFQDYAGRPFSNAQVAASLAAQGNGIGNGNLGEFRNAGVDTCGPYDVMLNLSFDAHDRLEEARFFPMGPAGAEGCRYNRARDFP